MDTEYIEIDNFISLEHETERAIQVKLLIGEKDMLKWVPKSQSYIEDDCLFVAAWLAEKDGDFEY